MTMSEEIKVGDRFVRVDEGGPFYIGEVVTADRLDPATQGWVVRRRDGSVVGGGRPWTCSLDDEGYWRRYADKPAPEVKGAEVKKVTVDEVDGMAKKLEAFYAQAGIPQQYSAANWGAEQWFVQNQQAYNQPGYGEQWWTQGTTKWGLGPEKPTPPAKALPFRYHQRCVVKHAPFTSMCLGCEQLWQADTEAHDREQGEHRYVTAKPVTRERYEPQCGAFVGRVLTPVRR
jgi:hypothetical protein